MKKTNTTTMIKKYINGKTISIAIGLILVLALLLWLKNAQFIQQGSVDQQNNTQTQQTPKSEQKPVLVAYRILQSQPYALTHKAAALTHAHRQVTLRAHTKGEITKRYGREGNIIAKNKLIARIDVDKRLIMLKNIKEQVAFAKKQLDNFEKLEKQGLQRTLDTAKAKADLAAVKEKQQSLELEISKLDVKTPFAGVIQTHHIEIGDFVREGDKIATIIDLDPLEIHFHINEYLINYIKKGQEITITLPDNKIRQAKIDYISSVAENATRTFEIRALLDNSDNKYLAGQSVDAIVTYEKNANAFFIPSSALSLNDDGILGVKLVVDDRKTRFQAIEFLTDDRHLNGDEGVWVLGLKNGDKLITQGQGFVKDGALITAILDQ